MRRGRMGRGQRLLGCKHQTSNQGAKYRHHISPVPKSGVYSNDGLSWPGSSRSPGSSSTRGLCESRRSLGGGSRSLGGTGGLASAVPVILMDCTASRLGGAWGDRGGLGRLGFPSGTRGGSRRDGRRGSSKRDGRRGGSDWLRGHSLGGGDGSAQLGNGTLAMPR
jgi:hypothetical protein